MRTLITLAAAGMLITGCVSMGTNYDPNAVSQLQIGMTAPQVIALLGKPNSAATMPDGRQQLIWVHSTGSMFGANARSVALVFGADGRLAQLPATASTQMQTR